MGNAEYRNFGQKLARHAAPTLLGIKCANLVSLSKSEFDVDVHSKGFNSRAAVRGLQSRILCECKNRILLLVYREKLLSARLADPQAREMLTACGYPADGDLEVCLAVLSERIRKNGDFPHEIGIFLGYPLEDVVGFIENHGENFKLCGCWKVYGCPENARRTFANYEKCRNFLCGKLNEGTDLYQALKIS
ncbi:MAG: DUF3793 family protein [Oscillospiraceae bacterium]|nr:DUF3793 family protein [Oscillospiraceae bacterium]MBQ9110550.1 DUF3793 family protein [Oscillospiraceae bacterium]